jgi:hypothetical protein
MIREACGRRKGSIVARSFVYRGSSLSRQTIAASLAESRSSNGCCVRITGPSCLRARGETLRWIVRVKRNVGASCFQNGEDRDHHLDRTLEAQRDKGLVADSKRPQMAREPVCLLVQSR